MPIPTPAEDRYAALVEDAAIICARRLGVACFEPLHDANADQVHRDGYRRDVRDVLDAAGVPEILAERDALRTEVTRLPLLADDLLTERDAARDQVERLTAALAESRSTVAAEIAGSILAQRDRVQANERLRDSGRRTGGLEEAAHIARAAASPVADEGTDAVAEFRRGIAEQVRRDLLAEFVPVADDVQRPTPSPQETADAFTAAHPIGTPVLFWPGERRGPGRRSAIRTPAWVLGHGAVVVSVDGYSGGINLTHVQVTEEGTDRG